MVVLVETHFGPQIENFGIHILGPKPKLLCKLENLVPIILIECYDQLGKTMPRFLCKLFNLSIVDETNRWATIVFAHQQDVPGVGI